MSSRLSFFSRANASKEKLSDRSDVKVGRSSSNDIVLDDPSVSKYHCRFRRQGRSVFIEDLGSMNGTWVNSERVASYGPLSRSDKVRVGQVNLDFTSWSTKWDLFPEDQDENESEPVDEPDLITLEEAVNNERQPDSAGLMEWHKLIHAEVIQQMDLRRKNLHSMTDDEVRNETSSLIDEVIRKRRAEIPEQINPTVLKKYVLEEAIGLGPLEDLLSDDSVTEIMVNSARQIFVERAGKLALSNRVFTSDEAVLGVIDRIITPIGRRIDESSPMVDARLKDGSRVNAIIPPLALKGPTITIRKFARKRLDFTDLVGFGTLNTPMAEFLKVCVERKRNIVVSGGTGTGKTTLLNVLSNLIPKDERIITVEDAAELQLNQPNLVSLEARPPNLEGKGLVSIRDLVKNALRMRPDRIVVGECRGGEALDMLQAMNTGHDGSLTTAHANSPRDLLSRLEVMVMMSGMDLPMQAIREQIASAVDIIVQQTRYPCGARKITYVTEVTGLESGTIQLQDIFLFQQKGVDEHGRVRGEFKPTGFVPEFYEELNAIGLKMDSSIFHGMEMPRV